MKKTTHDKKMSKLCKHGYSAYLAGMKHREYGKTTHCRYYGHTPLETLSFNNPLTRYNQIWWSNQCGATITASVNFTSKYAFFIYYSLGKKNCQKNSKSQHLKGV